MKKPIVFLLAVLMILQLLPTAAFAEPGPEAPAVAEIDGKGEYDSLENAYWAAVDGDTILLLEDQELGRLEICKDLTFMPKDKDVVLTLTGPALFGSVNSKNTFIISGNGEHTLTIQPKLTDGGINTFRPIAIRSSNKLVMQDGVILKGSHLTGAGGGMINVASGARFEMEGGWIEDCHVTSEDYDTANSLLGRGGALFVAPNAVFSMSGGEIRNCSATVAGGAAFVSGKIEMTGGKIDGCSVSGLDDGSGTVKAKGGAIYLYTGASITMTGGEISGCTLGAVEDMRGAGVYAADGTKITLGGETKINGNMDGNENVSNLFLHDGVAVTLGTEGNAPVTTGAARMNVGVTMQTPGAFTDASSASGAEVAKGCFTSDNSDYAVKFNSGYLELVTGCAIQPACSYQKKVSAITEGAFDLKLCGHDEGWFSFEAVEGGWKIMKSAEPGMVGMIENPYLAMKDGKLVYTDKDNATVWTYKNGAFSTSVETTQKNNGYWLGFVYIPGRGSKTVTTTYYLSTVTDNAKLSSFFVCAELYKTVTAGEHDFGCRIDCKNGTHKHVCRKCGEVETEECVYDNDTHKCVCGAYDPACTLVDVTATYSTRTQKQFSGFMLWGIWKNVTTYTAAVKVNTEGLKVMKIEVAASENGAWARSNIFTSNTEIEKFYVRVTTSDGAKHLFMVQDGIGYPAN